MNPATGRFITQDSYGGNIYDPASLHRYNYANANPTEYCDPTGYSAMGGSSNLCELEQGIAFEGWLHANLAEFIPNVRITIAELLSFETVDTIITLSKLDEICYTFSVNYSKKIEKQVEENNSNENSQNNEKAILRIILILTIIVNFMIILVMIQMYHPAKIGNGEVQKTKVLGTILKQDKLCIQI